MVNGTRPRAQDVDRHVGTRLRTLREAAGLTRPQLAALINVTYQSIEKYEGALNRIAASRLYALAIALGVEIGEFFDGLPATITCLTASMKETS